MTLGPHAETGAVIALTLLLVEVLKGLITKLTTRNAEPPPRDRTLDQLTMLLKDTHDVTSRRDADGVPLCYVPRALCTTQEEILKELRRISRLLDYATGHPQSRRHTL